MRLKSGTAGGLGCYFATVRVKMLYGKARKMARKYGACIIFIDEIDAIGMAGSGLLNELLMQMGPPPTDQSRKAKLLRKFGLRTKKAEMPAVFTMGATNLASVLDSALVSPGRLNWKISVERPNFEGRKEVLEYYLAKVKHDPDLPIDRIVAELITPDGQGYSPVEIKFAVNEGVVHAHFDGREAITYADICKAMETCEYGLRRKISGRTAEDKRRVAYHEAGHAIAMVRLYKRKRLERLTLMHYGEVHGAEGVAFEKAKEEIHIETREDLLLEMQIYLASKAAEIIFLGTETTGMGGDLPGATRLAIRYVQWGMTGNLFSDAFNSPMEGAINAEDRRAAERLLQQQFRLVKALLEQNKPHVHAIVKGLLKNEELLGEEVEEIVERIDRELGRSNGQVAELVAPTPQIRPAPEPEPAAVLRYAGATRRSEERELEGAKPPLPDG